MTAIHTFESFLSLARDNKWSRKQTRGELYKLNAPELWERRDELMTLLGFATTDQTEGARQAAAEQAQQDAARQLEEGKVRAEAARLAAEETARQKRAEAAAKREAALAAIPNGAIIFCDACENTVTRVVNSYGRHRKFDNGGYRVGIKCGDYEEVYYNSQCADQFAAECYAVLKAVEFAKERGLTRCVVRNDRIGGFEATTKKSKAATYLAVAERMAFDAELRVEFDLCTSATNEADEVCRQPGKVQ